MPNLQKTILNNLNSRLLVIHTMWFSFLRGILFQAKATFWEQKRSVSIELLINIM